MQFTKMHGLGNDFVLIENLDREIKNYSALSKLLSDRHFGIGADGIIYIEKSEKTDYKMRIFNPDGSEAEMCGNGIRCFAKYLHDNGLTRKRNLEVETKAGIIKPKLDTENGVVKSVSVNMGKAKILGMKALDIQGKTIVGDVVNIGNPHYVIRYQNLDEKEVKEFVTTYGPKIENHDAFPDRTNVEFAKIVSRDLINLYVWERGAGYTLACGTGACATAFSARKSGKVKEKVNVRLPGGTLEILIEEDDTIFMSGEAEEVFKGVLSKELLNKL